VITKGDTLWSIAKKYYPGQITSGIEKIKNANTDKLPEGKPLKIGVSLVIPP
jgi:phage tail protein X